MQGAVLKSVLWIYDGGGGGIVVVVGRGKVGGDGECWGMFAGVYRGPGDSYIV